jgi:hypothetical protein
MNYILTTEKAKNQAKLLATYLAGIKRKVSHGNALEAVAAMYGAKSWNVLSSQLENVVAPEAAPVEVSMPTLSYIVDGQEVPARVRAEVHSDDRRAELDFDAGPWLLKASDEEILDLAAIRWGGDEAADRVAMEMRQYDEDIEAVFTYVERANEVKSMFSDSMGFEVDIEESDALRFLRAFRYPVFVRIALEASFSSWDAVKDYGYLIEQNEVGKWAPYFKHRRLDQVYDTENEAWAALGKQLERNNIIDWDDFALEDAKPVKRESGIVKENTPAAPAQAVASAKPTVYDKMPGRSDDATGEVLVLKPGAPHLTTAKLRGITNDGEFYVSIAVPVRLGDLIDNDIEWVNDTVSEAITGSCAGLSDLSFKRYSPTDEALLVDTEDFVFVLVTAQWEPTDGMDDESDTDND